MKSNILLSICIPTYNRVEYIGEAIESILSQVTDDNKGFIEICISDNASTDNTEEIIKKYKNNSLINFIYHKNIKNEGFDYNILKVIDIANGKFCWFLGSDDKLEKGGINYILKSIKTNKINGIIVNRNVYSDNFNNPIKKYAEVAKGKYKKDILINTLDIYTDFFDYAGFMSSHIIKKELYNEVIKEGNIERWFNSYIHLYIVSKIFINNSNFLWIHKEFVGCRLGNDSFIENMQEGLVKRMYIDIDGYCNISKDLFSKKYQDKILSKIVGTLIRGHIIQIKNSRLPFLRKTYIFLKIIKIYYKNLTFWKKTFIFMISPKFILIFLRGIWRKYAIKKL